MKTSNIRLSILAAAAFSMVMTGVVIAQTVEGPIYDPYSKKNLFVVPLGSWSDAQAAAQALGGNLITIHNAKENQFVLANLLKDFSSSGGPNLSNLPLWIGLYDPIGAAADDGPGGPASQHAANFKWVDGSANKYRNWNSATSEPSDDRGGEYYTAINWQTAHGDTTPAGSWNDTPLAGTLGYGGNTDGPYYGIAAVDVPEQAVTLAATVPKVVVGSGDAGEFTLSLPAAQGADVTVAYNIKGSAINGVDYQLIRSSAKIKAGKTSKIIKIVPQGDLEGASKKAVTLVLNPGNGYTIGTTGKVKVKILSASGQ